MVSPDGVGPGHIPCSIEGSWEGSLQGNYVLDCSCGARGSHISQLHHEGRLSFKVRSIEYMLFESWHGMGHRVCRGVALHTIYSGR